MIDLNYLSADYDYRLLAEGVRCANVNLTVMLIAESAAAMLRGR